MRRTTGVKGFTLIELLVAVAIVGILAAVAVPAYQESIKKSRRSDAKIALTNLAALQERWYSINNGYTTTVANVGGSTSPEGFYTITLANTPCNNTTCFAATATAVGAQADDSKCTTFTLNQQGVKGFTGSGTSADCW